MSLVMAALDLVASVDAYANAVYSRSLLAEEDVAQRVLAVAVLQLILLVPSAFVWLIWLMASYLTLEDAGVEGLRFSARGVAGRFMWPGLRFDGGSSVVAALWEGTSRLPSPQAPAAPTRAPRWLVLLWLLPVVLVPFSLFTATVGDADEWPAQDIVALAMATDVLWLVAVGLCLYVVRKLEKRMRRREAALLPGPRRAPSTEANSA
jgi:hypothetical protein